MSKISLEVGRVIRDIREGLIHPVYLLYGEEEYLINTTLDRMIELLSSGEGAFDFDLFSGEGTPIKDVLISFDTYPMVHPFRLVVLKNHPAFSPPKKESKAERLAEERELLRKHISAKSHSSKVIFTYSESESDRVDTEGSLFKAISEKGRVLHFPALKHKDSLENDESFQIVANKLRRYKKTITPEAFLRLRELAGGNIGAVLDELDKVLSLIGDREAVEPQDVEEVVSRRQHEDLYGFTDSLLERSLPRALGELQTLLINQEPLRVLYFISRTYRFLMEAQLASQSGAAPKDVWGMNYNRFREGFPKITGEMEGRLPKDREHNLFKQHPYVAYKTMAALKNYSADELRESPFKILDADLRLKTTGHDPKLVLETLLVELCMPKNQGSYSERN